jgi:biotin carboxylase
MADPRLGSAPAVLVLGAGDDQRFMLRTAHEMGLVTAALDGNPRAPGLAEADFAAPIDFSKLEEVFAWVDARRAEGVPLAGVTTMGSDVPHLLAAIAARYGWAGPSLETGALATHKRRMKDAFARAGIPLPRYAAVRDPAELRAVWREWGCADVIVKPVDRAGSRGVRRLRQPDEAEEAFAHAQENGRCGEVLLEEYLEGPQISTESILWDDEDATPGYADRVYEGMDGFLPQIMENGGWVPSRCDAATTRAVSDLAVRAARALGIRRGPAKGDLVIHPTRGPCVIEIAARLSGGDFCESLVPLGTGVNYVRSVIDIALGRRPDFAALRPRFERAVANRYLFLPAGRLEAIEGWDELATSGDVHKHRLFYGVGDRIPPIQNHGQRVGVFVLSAPTRAEAAARVEAIYDRVRFRVDGLWQTARPPAPVPSFVP